MKHLKRKIIGAVSFLAIAMSAVACNVEPAHTHEYNHHDALAATCISAGMKEHYTCKSCDLYFDAQKVEIAKDKLVLAIDSSNHSTYLEHHDKVDSTCAVQGVDEHYECSKCHAFLDKSKVATTLDQLKLPLSETHSSTLVHHDAVPHTCEKDGTIEYWDCPTCNKKYNDEDGKAAHEITNIVDPTSGHNYVDYSGRPEGDEEHYGEVAIKRCEHCHASPVYKTGETNVIRIDERHLGEDVKDMKYTFKNVHVENDTSNYGPDFHLYSYVTGIAKKSPQVTTLTCRPFYLDTFQPTTSLDLPDAEGNPPKGNAAALDGHEKPSTYDFDLTFTFVGDVVSFDYQVRYKDGEEAVVFNNSRHFYIPRSQSCGEYFNIFLNQEAEKSLSMQIGELNIEELSVRTKEALTVDTETQWALNEENPGYRNQICENLGYVYKDIKIGETLSIVFSENIPSKPAFDNNYWHYFAYLYNGDTNEDLTATTAMSGIGDIGTNAIVCQRGNNAEAWHDGEMTKGNDNAAQRGHKWVSGDTNLTLATNARVEINVTRYSKERFMLGVFMKNAAGDTTASTSLVGLTTNYVTGGFEKLSFAIGTRTAQCKMISATIYKPVVA